MKKNILSLIAMILTILFLVLTAVFLILCKENAGNSLLNKCITAYISFVIIYLLYIIFTAVFNSIRIKGYYNKKKFIVFLVTFVVIAIAVFLFSSVTGINFKWYKNILIALFCAVVFFYSEAIFYLDNNEKK